MISRQRESWSAIGLLRQRQTKHKKRREIARFFHGPTEPPRVGARSPGAEYTQEIEECRKQVFALRYPGHRFDVQGMQPNSRPATTPAAINPDRDSARPPRELQQVYGQQDNQSRIEPVQQKARQMDGPTGRRPQIGSPRHAKSCQRMPVATRRMDMSERPQQRGGVMLLICGFL